MIIEYIYALTGLDGVPKYCGQTVNPDARLEQHVDEAKAGGKSLKCGWIRAVLSEGDNRPDARTARASHASLAGVHTE